MKYIKTFENLTTEDKIKKIKLLEDTLFFLLDKSMRREYFRRTQDFDTFYELQQRIVNLFKKSKFEISKNTFGKDVFKIKNGDLQIGILELKDEYFIVVIQKIEEVKDNIFTSEEIKIFIVDQRDGLLKLMDELHKIIEDK